MPLLLNPILAVTHVVIPIPLPSAQHMDSNATHVVAPTTLQHSAAEKMVTAQQTDSTLR